MATDLLIVLAAGLALVAFVRLPFFRSNAWHATATPLASIIGSGFLVVGPILDEVVGLAAPLAMAALCAGAWFLGDTMRFNIRHLEPLEAAGTLPRAASWAERASQWALAFAFVVSVTYYLNLLGAFALRGLGITDADAGRMLASGVLVGMALLGRFRGLHGLERVEVLAVGLKLAMIVGLLVGLGADDLATAFSGGTLFPDLGPHPLDGRAVRTLLGLLILVQGFETSRYLGGEYDPDTRIRTMRLAQLTSAAIYVLFITLLVPYFGADLSSDGGETAIIDMSAQVARVLPPMLVIAALSSQLSAAVADTTGCGGLVEELSGGRVSQGNAYLALAAGGLAITWGMDLLTLIAWASRAFAVYYGLQAIAGLWVARTLEGSESAGWTIRHALSALLAAAVVVFGIPAG